MNAIIKRHAEDAGGLLPAEIKYKYTAGRSGVERGSYGTEKGKLYFVG